MSLKDAPYFIGAVLLGLMVVTINYQEEPIQQKKPDFQQALLERLDQMNQIEFSQSR